MASNAYGCSFTSCNFLGISGLVVSLWVTWKVIGVTFLVVIEFYQTCIQPCLEGLQVHRVGIKDILIGNFFVVPTLWHMYLVSVGFGILLFLFTEYIARYVVCHTIFEAVVWVVQLLNLTSAPTCMVFRVSQCSFSFCRCWWIVFVLCADTIPVITFDYSVIVCRWIVIT